MGVGMMNMASGGVVGGVANGAFANQTTQGATQNYDPYNGGAHQPSAQQQDTSTNVAAEVPKFCPDCGTATNGAKFCSNCGRKLA